MSAVIVPAKITSRPIQRPNYTVADDFGRWLRLNHMLCWEYWEELEEAEGKDAERAGAFAEFHDFAKSQFDVHCASLDDDEETSPRVFRTADEAAAYEAGVPAHGEI